MGRSYGLVFRIDIFMGALLPAAAAGRRVCGCKIWMPYNGTRCVHDKNPSSSSCSSSPARSVNYDGSPCLSG